MRALPGKKEIIFSLIDEEAQEFAKLNGKKGFVKISDKNLIMLWKDLCDIIEVKCMKKSKNQS